MNVRQAQVWVSMDAMFAQSRLPRGVQDKYSKLIVKLKSDPAQRGLNFETIEGARDRHMKSARVDGGYRAILYDRAGVLIVLWVDEHDKAYRWARNRVVDVNPQSAAVQVIDMSLVPPATYVPHAGSALPQADIEPPRFAAFTDGDLLRLGVPESLLPAIRAMRSDADLDAAQSGLPRDAFDALTSLAAGYSVLETLTYLERAAAPPPIDADDLATALQSTESRRAFWLAESDDELEKMLDAPLEFWRVFLHPTQRRLVERSWNGPVLVRGGAGTGKTVVAMHRARYLADGLLRSGDEDGCILFTTFTSNLAADIRENLKTLCSREAMKRIEVMTLDAWVSSFLRNQQSPRRIEFNGDELSAAWESSYRPRRDAVGGLDLDFIKDEWKQVVQAQGIASLPEYLRAQRTGRGTSIDRQTKVKLWEVFAAYRAALDGQGILEVDDAYREAREILQAQSIPPSYRGVIVDEAQDMGPEAFRLLAAIAPKGPDNLFIVGDAHQRIYRRQASLGKCGIEVRGRSRNLRFNYRTTEEILRWAVALLNGMSVDDLDGGTDDLKGYRSLFHGPGPERRHCSDLAEQKQALLDWIGRCRASGVDDNEVGILARSIHAVNTIAGELQNAGFETVILEPRKADDQTRPGIRLATMHRAKGLEFGAVAIIGVNAGEVPPKHVVDKAQDKVVLETILKEERALLHVAATRAKKSLFIASWGAASHLLPESDPG